MKLNILIVSILLLLTQCGYFRPVNGQSILPTSSVFISTSPTMEPSSNFSSIDEPQTFSMTQSSSLATTEISTEISPSSDQNIISTLSIIDSQYSPSPSFSASTTSLSNVTAFPVMSSSEFSDMDTSSNIVDSSLYPASSDILSIASPSLYPASSDVLSVISTLSLYPASSDVLSIASTSSLSSASSDVLSIISTSSLYPASSDILNIASTSALYSASSDVLSVISTSSMFSSSFSSNNTSIMSMPSDTSSADISPTKTIVTDFSTSYLVTTDSNLTGFTGSTLTEPTPSDMPIGSSPESHTMSKSSKIAAGICIPLAIIAILGLAYYFYRRKRHEDRSIKFTNGESTWSYANASFADDAVKSSAQ